MFDSIGAARNIGLNSGLQLFQGSVSQFDLHDYNKIQVSSRTNIFVSAYELSGDITLSLLNSNGERITASNRNNFSAENINTVLEAGTYYIDIQQNSGETSYKLGVSSNSFFANTGDNANWIVGDFNGDGFQDALFQQKVEVEVNSIIANVNTPKARVENQGSMISRVLRHLNISRNFQVDSQVIMSQSPSGLLTLNASKPNNLQFVLGKQDGSFSNPVFIANMEAMSSNYVNLIAGDFNGDGKTDLIRQEKISLVNGINDVQFLSFENGNFKVVANAPEMATLTDNVANLIVGDFNGDKRADLIRQEKGLFINEVNDVQFLISDGNWGFAPPIQINDMSVMTNNVVTLVSNGGADLMRIERSAYVNGVNDIQFYSFKDGNFQFVGNEPTTSFSGGAPTRVITLTPIPIFPLQPSTPKSRINTDFDQDGQADILWQDSITGENKVWKMNGNIHVSDLKIDKGVESNWKIVATGDFDGDKKADLFWRNQVTGENVIWKMDKNKHVGDLPVARVDDIDWKVVAAADFDNDGKLDIVWRHSATGRNVLWKMDGNINAPYIEIESVTDLNWNIVGAGDFDGDQKTDILWRHSATGQNVVWRMDGPVHLSDVIIDTAYDVNYQIIGVADFTNDDKVDILWRHRVTGNSLIWKMNGLVHVEDLNVEALPDVRWKSVISTSIESKSLALPTVDLDQDGQADILWQNSETGENIVWKMSSNNHVSDMRIEREMDSNWKIVATGDFDGDRKTDLLWRNQVTGDNIIWKMDKNVHVSDLSFMKVADLAWKVVGVSDFDNDGKLDVLWRNSVTGKNILWKMDGNTQVNGFDLDPVADSNWKIVGVADFDRDQKTDILWRNSATGQNVVWKMDGKTHTGDLSFQSINDLNCQIIGLADFDKDGQVDVLWRNNSTGSNLIWKMDGVTRVKDLSVESVPDKRWKSVISTSIDSLSITPPVVNPNVIVNTDESPFVAAFKRAGGESVLGDKRNEVHRWGGGVVQDFTINGNNYSIIMQLDGTSQAYVVRGDFLQRYYTARGTGPASFFGYPTSDQYSFNGGYRQDFQGGFITKDSQGNFRAFSSSGLDSTNTWDPPPTNNVTLSPFPRQPAAPITPPVATPTPTPTPTPGPAPSIPSTPISTNNIDAVWETAKATVGNPISGYTPYGNVIYRLFEQGSIVSSSRGTFPLFGAIRACYKSNGGLDGWMGVPTTKEIGLGGGIVKQEFENGEIIWDGRNATARRYQAPVQPPVVVNPSPNPSPNPIPNPIPSPNPNPGTVAPVIVSGSLSPVSNKVDDFISRFNGASNIPRLDFNNLNGECVSLVARYLQEEYGQTGTMYLGNGKDTAATVASQFSQFFKPISDPADPIRGSIISFPGISAPFGHVAIVSETRRVNGVLQVRIIDSNSAQFGRVVRDHSEWISINESNFSASGYGAGITWTNPYSVPQPNKNESIILTNISDASGNRIHAGGFLKINGNIKNADLPKFFIDGKLLHGKTVLLNSNGDFEAIMKIPEDTLPKNNYEFKASLLSSSYSLYDRIDKDRFNINLNYDFDDIGFFDETKKRAMNEAARIWSDIIDDGFPDISIGTNAVFQLPSGGKYASFSEKVIDDLVINVGARQLDNINRYAETYSLLRENTVPVLLPDSLLKRLEGSNYQPWTAAIVFNKGSDFFYEFDKDVPKNKIDFLTTALHEIGHALGIGAVSSPASSKLSIWDSVNAGHIAGREDLMYYAAGPGERKLPSSLDKEALRAFGYSIK
jgi:surface antigen